AWLRAARTANPLSNAFLSLAAAARVHVPMLALLSAPTPDTLLPVLRFGHTSGADLLCALALLLRPECPP
ncbi:MAG: hypothetical protein IK066_12110, partial [Kiritimatiellae bacterium]|nr:hypothetical protein [Kiritimatiellia bacterium]